MKFANKIGKICKKVYDKMQDKNFAEVFKMKPQDFTRNRKIGFAGTMLIVLNKTGRGIKSAIRAYRETVKAETESYSAQAFSKGRMRIKWEAFREIFKMTVDEFYVEFKNEFKTFKGFRVCAVDGTKIDLPYSDDTVKDFGIQKCSGDLPQALGSCLYDALNGIILDAEIAPYNGSERALAKKHIENLSEMKTSKELIIFDRGYPSSELISFIEQIGFKYLMRLDGTFAKGLLQKAQSNDCIVTHRFRKPKIEVTVRLIQLPIKDSNGNEITEVLITNVFDDSFTFDDFKYLYHVRWGIESKYNDIKNKLQIESFSGTTTLAIKQDFYATMFLSNLASIMVFENAEEIDRVHNSNDNKYQYKANINATISILKEKVILMLITDSPRKSKKLMKHIYSELAHAVVPIRDGRSYPRVKKHRSSKFHQNQKA